MEQSSVVLLAKCPHCGTETETGFGLAGGGYGVYAYCPNEACGGEYFAKRQSNDDE